MTPTEARLLGIMSLYLLSISHHESHSSDLMCWTPEGVALVSPFQRDLSLDGLSLRSGATMLTIAVRAV